MTIPAFDDKELKVVGEGFWPLTGNFPIFNYPITTKQAYKSMVQDKKPVWQMTGIEYRVFTPHIIPDNVARGFVFEALPFDANTQGGGKDMFGVDWEYIKQVGGSMVRPGNPMLEDMNDWEDVLVWPDVDSWDWAKSAEDNKQYLETDDVVQAWFQTGFFERIISFMEFEGAILALVDEDQQDAVHAFYKKLSDLYINIFEHYCHYFPQVDAFYIHDDWGSQKETFFSPAVPAEMIVPYMRKVTDFLHSKGKTCEFHSCGMNMKQVPNMIDAGWDIWCGQPMNDTHALYEQYGDKIIIGIYPDDVDLVNSSEDVQRQEARKFAEKFCNPDKPCVINFNNSKVLPLAYREELYKQSRIRFAK
jgi:hypothetical protein